MQCTCDLVYDSKLGKWTVISDKDCPFENERGYTHGKD